MEPTSNSNDSTQTGGFNLLSPTLRRVLDALLEGRTIESSDRAALTEAEWIELRALARTANLTRLTLHQPDPTPQAEASALAQAQKILAEIGPRSSAHPQALAPLNNKLSWLERLRGFLGIEEDKD
ncbi:hypothetical protein [Armatimonas sp.]|uniref:hypothetical protein n=1 Tax=Armatimonas sp. TaxID=1872638 RepID=UPI0037526ABA